MGAARFNVKINDKGEFQSVMFGNKSYSLNDWNNMMKATPTGYVPPSDAAGAHADQKPVYGPQP